LTKGRIPPVLTRYKSSAIWKPLRYSNAKAKNKLNWQPKISIEEGLQRTIAG
jgi:nucleoside-diphosphate-sugar epimerase